MGCDRAFYSSRLSPNASFAPVIEMVHSVICHVISAMAASVFIEPDVCQIHLGHLILSLHLNLHFQKNVPFPFGPFYNLAAKRRDA